MKNAPQARGQSTVETALVGLLFTTVLIFGIHFAEVGFLSLKVTEAANAALFKQPFAPNIHNAGAGTWGNQGNVAAEATLVRDRYKDFDGRRSHNGDGTITQVFTRANQMQVECNPTALNAFGPDGNSLNTSGRNAAGCGAQAEVSAFRIPKQFFQSGQKGFFKAKHLAGVESGFQVCAFGTSTGGCPGRVAVLLDDWGLTGAAEAADNTLGTHSNPGFYNAAEKMFQWKYAGGTPGRALSATVGAERDASEDQFFLSSLSQGVGYTQNISSHQGLGPRWETTPYTLNKVPTGYYTAYENRSACFLGMPCGKF